MSKNKFGDIFKSKGKEFIKKTFSDTTKKSYTSSTSNSNFKPSFPKKEYTPYLKDG